MSLVVLLIVLLVFCGSPPVYFSDLLVPPAFKHCRNIRVFLEGRLFLTLASTFPSSWQTLAFITTSVPHLTTRMRPHSHLPYRCRLSSDT
jgi:hypothetical protein